MVCTLWGVDGVHDTVDFVKNGVHTADGVHNTVDFVKNGVHTANGVRSQYRGFC